MEQMLATFKDPKFVNNAYRSQIAFGYGEDIVLAGDDQGGLWAWNTIDVGFRWLTNLVDAMLSILFDSRNRLRPSLQRSIQK